SAAAGPFVAAVGGWCAAAIQRSVSSSLTKMKHESASFETKKSAVSTNVFSHSRDEAKILPHSTSVRKRSSLARNASSRRRREVISRDNRVRPPSTLGYV